MLVLWLGVTGACSAPPTPGDVAFVGVDVVDVRAGAIAPDRTVVVADGRIAAIGPRTGISLAPDVRVVDADGQYLAPGLMEMHGHVFTPDVLPLFLANGITTVRNMWGGPETRAMRDAIASGQLVGPRLLTAGALLDGAPKIWAGSTELSDPQAAAALVAQQAEDGYDFVKVYTRLSPEVFDALMAAAREHSIHVAGHVPQSVPLRHAVASGMRTTEHMVGMLHAVFADPDLPNPDLARFDEAAAEFIASIGRGETDVDGLVDPEQVAALGQALASADTWLVPTVDVMKNFTSLERRAHPEIARYLPLPDQQILQSFAESPFAPPPDLVAGEDALFALRARVLKQLHAAGARLLVGTDDSLQYGFVLVDEMQTLVELGLSNAEVLRAATTEPARYLGEVGQTGAVVVGAGADLILLDADPLQDLNALRAPSGVMRAGIWYTRAELDALLEAVAAKHAAVAARFAGAPAFAPEAGVPSDFVSDSAAVRVASRTGEGGTTVTAAFRSGDAWTQASFAIAPGAFRVQARDGSALRAVRGPGGWQLGTEAGRIGAPAAGDAAAVLTGTPADILILNAAVGTLARDETRDLVLWRCGPDLDCASASPEAVTVTGLGTVLINGHRIYESANAYQVRARDGEAGSTEPAPRPIDYWMAPPGLFSGGPVRIDFDDGRAWRRVR